MFSSYSVDLRIDIMDFPEEPSVVVFNPVCRGLPFDESEIASTFSSKSSSNYVFSNSRLSDGENANLGLMILFSHFISNEETSQTKH